VSINSEEGNGKPVQHHSISIHPHTRVHCGGGKIIRADGVELEALINSMRTSHSLVSHHNHESDDDEINERNSSQRRYVCQVRQ
jgi:hypothetical protein